MPLKITFYNESKAPGNTLADFGFHIEEWDMYFTNCRLMQKKDGSGKFISFPSYKTTDDSGQVKYKNYFWWGPNTNRKLQDALLKAIEEFTAKKSPVEADEYCEENVPF